MTTTSRKIPFIDEEQFNKRLEGLHIISIRPCTPDQTDTHPWFLIVYWD